jgi:hypothetical protein
MTVKCDRCGAPDESNDSSRCQFCDGALKLDKQSKPLIKEFISIKFEYQQGNYSKVIFLTDSYLKNDPLNILCWAYKITADFLNKSEISSSYNFEFLISCLKSLLEFEITNSLSQKIIENQLLTVFEIIKNKDVKIKSDNKIENFVLFYEFLTGNFSNDFMNQLNEKFTDVFKMLRDKEKKINDFDLDDKDSLFEDAAILIVSSQSGSTSLLQRRMKLGYNRAGRLMDQLEAAGIVGPNLGSKVRDVLIQTNVELENKFASFSKQESIVVPDLNMGISKNPVQENLEVNKNKGCFIATATMGDYNHPVVLDLRLFRDNWLLKRKWGVIFTGWYYKKGPYFAKIIDQSYLLKKLSFYFLIKPLQIVTKYFFL